jgi:hypothetical protein
LPFAAPVSWAHADELVGAAPQPARKANAVSAARATDPAQGLQQGVVTAMSRGGDMVEIQGRWHRIDAERTRIFRSGRAADVKALRIGQALKFTLAVGPGEPALGVVYVP